MKFNSLALQACGDPWTIKEYKLEFMSILESINVPGLSCEPLNKSNEFAYVFPEIKYSFLITDEEKQIGAEITRSADIIRGINERTERVLIERLNASSLVAYFRFLPEVQVACGQYLLYFTQFLRELGVESNATLTNEADQVLFKVTPTNKREALDKIRMALHVFLQLPSIPIDDVASEGIAVQKLEANILRLRGDLKLAAAEMEAKNATIQTQKLMIDIQKGLLSGEIISQSMRDVTPKPKDKDKEELLGGTVALIPVEGKGVRINLPEIFRRLKQLLSDTE